MNNQNLTHNVKPIAIAATTVVCHAALWFCDYRMPKRGGCGLVGGFST